MLQIAVCDDEAPVRAYLERQIKETAKCRVFLFSDGKELLEQKSAPDIVFLEIEENKKEGLALAKRIRREGNALVIFISSVDKYVFDAFDAEAFHYLLKPLDKEKVREVLLRAVEEKLGQKEREPLVVKANRSHYHIEKKDILYIENEARKVVLHMREGILEFYAKMDELEEELGRQFFRCHRGYLVNLDAVKKYETGSILLENGEAILMAKKKYNEFAAAYTEFVRKNG